MRIYGYGRVSTANQDVSPDVQRRSIANYVDQNLMSGRWPDAQYGGAFIDEAVTSRIPLLERPMVNEILMLVNPGDVIVIHRFDRAFRSAADAERTFDVMKEIDVTLIFLDYPIDTSTAQGQMFASILASFARFERQLISERTAEAHKELRRQGKTCNGFAHCGWKLKRSKHTRILVPDQQRRQFAYAVKDRILTGITREELFRTFRPLAHMYGFQRPPAEKTLVNMACAACLGFPRMGLDRAENLLKESIQTMQFVHRTDHDAVRERLHKLATEDGEII